MVAIIVAIMPSVEPQVTVISVSGSMSSPRNQRVLSAMASRKSFAPHVTAYWFTSSLMAAAAARFKSSGAGLVYEEQGRHEEAAESFRKAIAQLSDTEPVVYELLARNLEKLERWKEAVVAYEKYLEVAPQGAHASAINSIIDQLRKQAAEAEGQAPPL